jgi:hypothetical protein
MVCGLKILVKPDRLRAFTIGKYANWKWEIVEKYKKRFFNPNVEGYVYSFEFTCGNNFYRRGVHSKHDYVEYGEIDALAKRLIDRILEERHLFG